MTTYHRFFDSNGSCIDDAKLEAFVSSTAVGTLCIHFEAMPPFFAEDEGIEQEFEKFETKLQDALGVLARRDDREVFVISKPNADTVEKARAWLETYRKKGA